MVMKNARDRFRNFKFLPPKKADSPWRITIKQKQNSNKYLNWGIFQGEK